MQPMADKLISKAESKSMTVTIGDFADVAVASNYDLVYEVYNTFFNLLTQDDQVRCFQNVAAHLTDTGSFVIEAFTPGYLYRLENNQYVDAESIELKRVKLDVGRHDPVTQRLDESHIELTAEGVRLFPIVCRYAWPSELDLMARIAGLRLKDRWGGWNGEPFTASIVRHISVYGK